MASRIAVALIGIMAAMFFSGSSLAYPTLVEDGGGPIVMIDPDEYGNNFY